MILKTLTWLALVVATVFAMVYVTAWASPVTYLKMQSQIGLAPISISWALQRANDALISESYDFCRQPVLFAWYGSFGGGPVLSDDRIVPAMAEFEEVVLFRSGIVRESTRTALGEMAVYNEEILSRCFADAAS